MSTDRLRGSNLNELMQKGCGELTAFLERSWLLVSLLWTFLFLSPLLDAGFISDDAYNSQISGRLILEDITVWSRIYEESLGWLTGAGRFNPLNWFYLYGFYSLEPSSLATKVMTVSLVFASISLFAQYIYVFTGCKRLRLLVVLLLPTLIQFRLWHDPVLAFTGIIPFVLMLCFASLLLWQNSLRSEENSKLFLTLSLLLFALALLTYELSYFLAPLFFLTLIPQSAKDKTHLKIFGLFSIVCLVLVHYLISKSFLAVDNSYPGLVPRIDPSYFAAAAFNQVTAALPLSYRFADGVPHPKVFRELGIFTLIFVVLTGVFTYAVWTWRGIIVSKRIVSVCALCLILLPAAPAVISGHQESIALRGFGFGYIVVYGQYFGVCLAILIGLGAFVNYTRKYSPTLGISTIFFLSYASIVVTSAGNSFAVKQLDWPYKTPRVALERIIEGGILSNVSERDVLVKRYAVPSDNGWFYSQVAGRKINTCSYNIENDFIPCLTRHLKAFPSARVYGFSYVVGSDDSFFAVLSSITIPHSLDELKYGRIAINDYTLFKDGVLSEISLSSPINFVKFLSAPPRVSGAVNPESFHVYDFPDYKVDFQKFWPMESDGVSELRWSSGRSNVKIFHEGSRIGRATLVFDIIRPSELLLDVSVLMKDKTIFHGSFSGRRNVRLPIQLVPGWNSFEFVSGSDEIGNGDPRKIVFGVIDLHLER